MKKIISRDTINDSLISTLYLAFAVPLIVIGYLWTVWPILAITLAVLVFLFYAKTLLIALATLEEIEPWE